MAKKKVGTITHFYDHLGVCVVDLKNPLSLGDEIEISGKTSEFTQEVESMQIDHQSVKKAGKGKSVGLKIDKKVKKGDLVYLLK